MNDIKTQKNADKCQEYTLRIVYNIIFSMQIYSDKLFKNPIEIIEIFEPEFVKSGLNKIEELKNKGLHLVGYMRYDLSKTLNDYPLIYFEAFNTYEKFITKSLEYKIGTVLEPLITKDEYFNKIECIKNKIENGIIYEVNYTYPSILKTNADEFELYNYFLQNQTTPYNAFLKNKYETILSFSPEMFFTLNGRKILTKPMKGTIHRGRTKQEDEILKNFLGNDIKNKSENIMIVDLLRNDLGKISKTGSVHVDKLFEIEEHKTLFQMTSEITAELENNITLNEIVEAIYPCGSITGAPKVSAMRAIAETEISSRNVYCGAIGYLYKDYAVFSVPIRILQRKNCENYYKYWAGGAIVWDSQAKDEWEETLTKTEFLQTDFSIIETMKDDFELHIARMKNSAQKLGFCWNKDIEKLHINNDIVTRIELFKNGKFSVTYRPIPPTVSNPKIKIGYKVNSFNPFLYHKTSIRKQIPKDVFDEIGINEKDEITEGTFTNIAVQNGENIYTPPVKCGLLNGVLRQKLIKSGKMKEKVLYMDDLKQADKIYCLNSIRGIVEVELC